MRRAIHRLLSSAGHEVKVFASGVDFLKSFEIDQPDCVVLDLHMPGMNGFDVQSQLARAKEKTALVVITGHDTAGTRKRVIDAGAAAYLRKPVDEAVLLEAITNAIASKRGKET